MRRYEVVFDNGDSMYIDAEDLIEKGTTPTVLVKEGAVVETKSLTHGKRVFFD